VKIVEDYITLGPVERLEMVRYFRMYDMCPCFKCMFIKPIRHFTSKVPGVESICAGCHFGRKPVNEKHALNIKKTRCRDETKKIIRRGEISRPESCEVCHKAGKVESHHINYDHPRAVWFLCKRCHMDVHSNRVSLYPQNRGLNSE
jgi:hypothetical protein